MIKRLCTIAAASLCLIGASHAAPTTINFPDVPTATSYISSGLLLGASDSFIVGGCGTGSVGCLGSGGFSGWLDFSFVLPNTTTSATTNMVSFITCRACDGRPTSASVYDNLGGLLTTINMNVSGDLAAHTFTYSAANIGRVRVNLGYDAIESISFNAIGASNANDVPEPTTLALVGAALAGAGLLRRRSA